MDKLLISLTQNPSSKYLLTVVKARLTVDTKSPLTKGALNKTMDETLESLSTLKKQGYATGAIVIDRNQYKDFYAYTHGLGVLIPIDEEEFWDLYECLPPRYIIGPGQLIVAVVPECITADFYTVVIRYPVGSGYKYYRTVASSQSQSSNATFDDLALYVALNGDVLMEGEICKIEDWHDSRELTDLKTKLKAMGATYNVDTAFN